MHEGHRKRMCAKLENGENLFDHEVLEMLLFNGSPRVNTNPVAHALLERFCSLSEIFKADVEELKTVEGVGENLANYIRIVGLCSDRCGNTEGVAVLKTAGDCKRFVSYRLKGKIEENLELYFIEKSGRVKRVYTYTSYEKNKAEARAEEIIRNIAVNRPYALLAAHNHVGGVAEPSQNDDLFTKQLQLICNMNSVLLLDHLIYADGKFFSYKNDGGLEEIQRTYSLRNTFKWIKTSDLT